MAQSGGTHRERLDTRALQAPGQTRAECGPLSRDHEGNRPENAAAAAALTLPPQTRPSSRSRALLGGRVSSMPQEMLGGGGVPNPGAARSPPSGDMLSAMAWGVSREVGRVRGGGRGVRSPRKLLAWGSSGRRGISSHSQAGGSLVGDVGTESGGQRLEESLGGVPHASVSSSPPPGQLRPCGLAS